jgi:hypothetical protein
VAAHREYGHASASGRGDVSRGSTVVADDDLATLWRAGTPAP